MVTVLTTTTEYAADTLTAQQMDRLCQPKEISTSALRQVQVEQLQAPQLRDVELNAQTLTLFKLSEWQLSLPS